MLYSILSSNFSSFFVEKRILNKGAAVTPCDLWLKTFLLIAEIQCHFELGRIYTSPGSFVPPTAYG
jgi:hypothetical protein